MIAKADGIKAKMEKTNVTFIKSSITDIAVLDSGIADCIISNCVINLVPAAEKHLVFKEAHRLLKHGGRLAVSDILAKKPLPEKLRSDMALYVGCISGASLVSEYERFLKDAGFGGKCREVCNTWQGFIAEAKSLGNQTSSSATPVVI
jgi:arsenite methyltransferase